MEYGAKNPDTKLYHIQLTDGEVTDGEKDHDRLAELVNPDYTNILVGFGKYHDDRLLSKLSENPRNDYRFIDKLEFSKVVYGEILYNILYHRYDEVEIEVHGAQIYNWRTNQWGSRLMLSNIPYDCERMFQLRADATSDPPSSVEAFVWTTPSQMHGGPSKIYCYPELMDIESNEREVRDLTRYSFRQRTQELLYEVRECIKRQNNTEDSIDSFSDSLNDAEALLDAEASGVFGGRGFASEAKLFTPSLEVETAEPNTEKNEKRAIYEKCREFMRTIKEYMDANNAKHDRSLRLLQDDIYIVLKTLYRRNAHMWCATRHISLGREHSYQPTQGFDAGKLYFRNIATDTIHPASASLSAVFLKYPNYVQTELNNDVYYFALYSDTFVLETKNYVIVDTILFNYESAKINPTNYVGTYIQKSFLNSSLEIFVNEWLVTHENNLYLCFLNLLPSVSASNYKALYPRIYRVNLYTLQADVVYPGPEVNILQTYSLSAGFIDPPQINIEKIDGASFSYFDRNNIFNITYLGKNLNSIPFVYNEQLVQSFPYFSSLSRYYRDWETDRKSTRLNSSHSAKSRMPSPA